MNNRLIANQVGDRGDEVWQLALAEPATWSKLSPSGVQPRERAFSATVSDPSRHRIVVFGGMTSDGNVNDLVALEWEIPDGVTPVLISLVSTAVVDHRVRVTWQAQGDGIRFTVERAEAGGPWRSLSPVLPDASGQIMFDDSAVSPGTRYGYRLIPDGGGNPLGEVGYCGR